MITKETAVSNLISITIAVVTTFISVFFYIKQERQDKELEQRQETARLQDAIKSNREFIIIIQKDIQYLEKNLSELKEMQKYRIRHYAKKIEFETDTLKQ